MLYRTPTTDVWNCKIKRYPNGSWYQTVASRPVFHKPLDEYPEEELAVVSDGFLNEVTGEWIEPERSKDKDGFDRGDVNEVRSLCRARNAVHDICLCNMDKWQYFFTITFNDAIVNASDTPLVLAKLSRWLNRMQQSRGLEYLLVPEYHKKNRRIHAHCLCNDVFTLVDSGTRIIDGFRKPIRLSSIRPNERSKIRSIVYNVQEWKYGFATAIPTYGDGKAMTAYVTKYITKGSEKIFGKYYWSSRELIRKPQEEFSSVDFQTFDAPVYDVPGVALHLKYASSDVFEFYIGDHNVDAIRALPWE